VVSAERSASGNGLLAESRAAFLESQLGDECRDSSSQEQVYKADGRGLSKTETVSPLVPREPV
jgi:hypothetical protein